MSGGNDKVPGRSHLVSTRDNEVSRRGIHRLSASDYSLPADHNEVPDRVHEVPGARHQLPDGVYEVPGADHQVPALVLFAVCAKTRGVVKVGSGARDAALVRHAGTCEECGIG